MVKVEEAENVNLGVSKQVGVNRILNISMNQTARLLTEKGSVKEGLGGACER